MLIVAARQSGAFFSCRVRWWPTGTALSVEGGAAAIAFDVHLQDGDVMHEAVDGGEVMAWSRNTLPDSPNG
jgi:hypothetical protein